MIPIAKEKLEVGQRIVYVRNEFIFVGEVELVEGTMMLRKYIYVDDLGQSPSQEIYERYLVPKGIPVLPDGIYACPVDMEASKYQLGLSPGHLMEIK